MPFPDADYERSWKMQAAGVPLCPTKHTPNLRRGIVIERTTAGCMCRALSAYDSLAYGDINFHEATEGTPRYGVSWTKGLEGRCGCGRPVTYDEFLLVIDAAEGRSE